MHILSLVTDKGQVSRCAARQASIDRHITHCDMGPDMCEHLCLGDNLASLQCELYKTQKLEISFREKIFYSGSFNII